MTNILIQSILVFATALAVSLILVPLLLKLAAKYQLYDAPFSKYEDKEAWRKVHRGEIPRLGGVAIFFGALCGYWLVHAPGIYSILIPGALIFLIGVADDLFQLRARWRLLLQVLLAFAAVQLTDLAPSHLNLWPQVSVMLPTWLGSGLGIFIIVGAINAANMIDGLDGLAAGLVLIALLLSSFMTYFHFQSFHQILAITLPLIGAVLGFLKYNTHPAKIFMGDGGSNFLGYFVGVFLLLLICNKTVLFNQGVYSIVDRSMLVSGNSKTLAMIPLFSILLAFALPIYDSACVIAFRLKNKKNPFKADNSHFHHAMLRVGLTQSQTVTTMYFIALLVGIAGLVSLVFPAPKYSFDWISYAVTAILLFAIVGGRKANKEFIDRIKNSRLLLSRSGKDSKSMQLLLGYWESLNKYLLYAFLAIIPLFAGVQKEVIGYGAIIAASLVFISFFFKSAENDFVDSLLLSIGICLLLVVNNQNPMSVMFQGKVHNIHHLYNYLFVFLFFSTFLFVMFTMRKRYLEISPTDFLLACLPLMLLLTPEPYRETYRLNIIGLRSLVVFMVLRMFARRNRQIVHHARVLTLLGLVYVILTSLLGFRIVYN